MKALIVDDEYNVRKIIRCMGQWETHGITGIMEARNGEEAKAVIERECPEIVITDVKMPKESGIELIEWLHSKCYTGKVILLTGFDDYRFMRKAIQCGSYDYLLKPIEAVMLNQALAGAIAAWREEEAERCSKEKGDYEDFRRFRINRDVTSALTGKLGDIDGEALSLPQADAYDLTLILFYQTHHSEPYMKLLSDELIARQWGNAFALQNDRNLCVMISVHGRSLQIEEWMANHFDISVRLVSGGPMKSLEDLPASFQSARKAMAEQKFRAIHRLSEFDEARRMQDIIAFVNEHYLEDFSLDTLSARFFLSREHISRRFKQENGMTLSSYVVQLRIQQAKIWLSQTNEKIYAIAFKLGYKDEFYFSKLFKKIVGMTPGEYRNAGGKSKGDPREA